MIDRTGKFAFGLALAAFAAALLTASPVSAQEKAETDAEKAEVDERMAEFRQRVEEVRERLQLTDEQVEQLLPILRENFEGRMAVLEKHGVDVQSMAEGGSNRRLNLRQFRALNEDMGEAREAMFEKIEELDFLSDEQFEEFRNIQQEQREALRERLRARRGSR